PPAEAEGLPESGFARDDAVQSPPQSDKFAVGYRNLMSFRRKSSSCQDPSENQGGELRHQIVGLQLALRLIPLVDPVDHSQQGKRGGAGADGTFGLTGPLYFGNQVLDEVNVFLLADVDAFAEHGRQGMVFVQHDRDLPVHRAEHHFDVQADQGAQALFRIGDAAHRSEHTLLGNLHGVVHDLEQDFVLALKMVVQTAFAELESGGDVVHGSGVVASLLKQAGGSAQDFLPGVNHGLAGHRRHGNAE